MAVDRSETPSDRYLCGWKVRTTMALPELVAWAGDDRSPDLLIRTGAAPPRLSAARDVSPLLQINADGQARLSIDGVATYWLLDANEIVVDPQIDPGSPDVRTFLFSTILGLLCHRRGRLPLQASCVVVGGKAIAFSGVSGTGKSTFAAALVRRGHRLLSDDVCVIDAGAPGGPVVHPSFPRVKLWRDSLEAMGLSVEGLPANRIGQDKYHLRWNDPAAFQTDPVALESIYLLDTLAAPVAAGEEVRRLTAMQATMELHDRIYRKRTALLWGAAAEMFTAVGRIVDAASPYRLSRGPHLADLDAMVRRIEAHVAI